MASNAAPPPVPTPDQLAVDARRLAALLGVSVRSIRAGDAAGKLPRPNRFGGRVLWSVDEIRRWIAAGMPPREIWEKNKTAR